MRAYRRKGLDPMASNMFRYLTSRGVDGSDVLEVGGGIGVLQLELLKAGARSSVNVELSAGYEEAAAELAAETGFEERLTRRVGDFVELQDEVDEADIVVMNRVVCCYPWMGRLMGAAARKTKSLLAIVVPRDRWWVKTGQTIGNGYMAFRKCDFRAFVHPVTEIRSVAEHSGLALVHSDQNLIWQTLVLERVG